MTSKDESLREDSTFFRSGLSSIYALGSGDLPGYICNNYGEEIEMVVIKNVLCCPSLKANLISVGCLFDVGVSCTFGADGALLKFPNGKIFNAYRINNLFNIIFRSAIDNPDRKKVESSLNDSSFDVRMQPIMTLYWLFT